MRETKEIKIEIEKLKLIKPKVRVQSVFGDNHHEAIEAQIEVLEEKMTEETVLNHFPSIEEDEEDGFKQNIIDAVMDAVYWLENVDSPSLSEDWKALVIK